MTTAPVRTMLAPGRRGGPVPVRQPPLLYAGLALASVGGPLALVALYLPGILAGTRGPGGLVVVLAVAAFSAPLLIWCRYSSHLTGPGGLYAFTLAAAGPRAARVQAGLWTVSYLLYLLYTVDYVVYDLLPVAVPALTPYRPLLELTVPLVIAAVVLAPLRRALAVLTVLAAGQLLIGLALAAVLVRHSGAPAAAFTGQGPARPLAEATGNTALLFVCASLPLFLGAEVAGGGRTVRRSLVGAVAATGVLAVLVAVPLAGTGRLAGAELPGMAMARAYSGEPLATTVGLGVAASVLGLVVVEYLALTRLVHAVTSWAPRTVARWLVVPFLGAGVVSLADPGRFYGDLLRPSLVALWLAQLIPVAVYPRLAARVRRMRPSDVVAAVVASGLMLFGLYSSLANVAAS